MTFSKKDSTKDFASDFNPFSSFGPDAASGGSDATTNFLLRGIDRVESQFAEFRDEASSPVINILFFDNFAHAANPHLLFFRFHFKGYPNRFGALVDVVGIYQQCIAQFARSSGELAQDQHTAFVAPRREKLLRHQIHAVVQRCDHAHVGGAVVPLDFFMVVLVIQKYNGLPFAGLKPPINAFRFRFQFRHQIVIPLDVGAAGRSNLNEGELLPVFGIFLQESFD
jgi:hypothetical protein